jgi:hypothetical protein
MLLTAAATPVTLQQPQSIFISSEGTNMRIGLALMLGGLLASWNASAADYTGTISMLEVWSSGNIAFRLSPVAPAVNNGCGDQFIVNKTDDGAKNIYAALLASQKADTQVRVSSYACGPAAGLAGSSYNLVTYLYPLD